MSMAYKPHFQVHTQHMNKKNSKRWYCVQCTCHGHFIYLCIQVTSVSLSGNTHLILDCHQKHWAWIFLLSPLQHLTAFLHSASTCSLQKWTCNTADWESACTLWANSGLEVIPSKHDDSDSSTCTQEHLLWWEQFRLMLIYSYACVSKTVCIMTMLNSST